MRQAGLRGRGPRRFKSTTKSNHDHLVEPNLLNQEFSAQSPDSVWVGDITWIPTTQGPCYLAVLLDLYSRMVVGWAFDSSPRTELVESALRTALGWRTPSAGLIHHSDRGCQYTSNRYRGLLARNRIRGSMSRKGDCYDNAVAESFFGTLKQELVRDAKWKTRAEARAAIHDYIEVFYNRQRLHSAIDYCPPAEFELQAVHKL